MQNLIKIRKLMAVAAILLIPFALAAQEIKKEIHIKTIKDGVVTEDTVFIFPGDFPESLHKEMMEMRMADMEEMMMKKEQIMMMCDSVLKDIAWETEGDHHREMRVIVRNRDGEPNDELSEVEEIWVDKPADGAPCKTIIIHQGDCPGGDFEHRVQVFHGEGMEEMGHMSHDENGPVKIEKKVIKTDGGEKIIIIETDGNSKTETVTVTEKDSKAGDSKKDKEKEKKSK